MISEEYLRWAWQNHPIQHICAMLGCSPRHVYHYVHKYRLPPKPQGSYLPRSARRRADPTPEEIRAGCLEVQARWTPEERARRAGAVDGRPTVRFYDYDGRSITFSQKML